MLLRSPSGVRTWVVLSLVGPLGSGLAQGRGAQDAPTTAAVLSTGRDVDPRLRWALERQRLESLDSAGAYGEAARGYVALAAEIIQARIDERRSASLRAIESGAPRPYELLYNAGVLFARIGRLGDAVAAWEQLLRGAAAPHELQERALGQLGAARLSLLDFAGAAAAHEERARRYPKSRESEAGLEQAARLRWALGDLGRFEADVDLLMRNYGLTRRDVAERFLGLALLDLPLPLGQRYLTQAVSGGRTLGRWLQLLAAGRLGELLWRASCPAPDKVDRADRGAGSRLHASWSGLPPLRVCAEVRVLPKAEQQPCGPRREVRPIARVAAQVAEAERLFAVTAGLLRDGGVGQGDESPEELRARRQAAQVQLARGMRAHEALLREAPPGPLNLDASAAAEVRAESLKRLGQWYGATRRRLEEAERFYVQAAHEPYADRAAAMYWGGRLYHDWAERIRGVAPPRKMSREVSAAYCKALEDAAEPIWQRAKDAYGRCAEVAAVRLQPEWAARCAEGLLQIEGQPARGQEIVPGLLDGLPALVVDGIL